MSKKVTHTFKTLEKHGNRYMICRNSIEDDSHWSWSTLKDGVRCNNWEQVGKNAVAVLCWKCTARNTGAPEVGQKYVSKGRPRGWQFMSEYVDGDGNVFHKGVEQPALKGTLPVTIILDRVNRKTTKQEKARMRDEILQEIVATRAIIKTAQTKKEIKANHVKLNKLERRLKKLN
jgi:hypothetical protein